MKKFVDESCIFCKIIAGDIPCARVYEDERIFAFLDINPIVAGHTLVAFKAHYPTLLDAPADEGKALLEAVKKVAGALLGVTKAGGFNCIQNNFRCAGQTVFHSHWHIVPRFDNDGLPDWPGGKYDDTSTMQELARVISTHIDSGAAGDSQ
ncbi:MAG: HIT family protein [Desulfovibrio sp.]|jgi:histidine triad (HIT) family protein|nr:HIT family protein [Desulfovibrio sp.]